MEYSIPSVDCSEVLSYISLKGNASCSCGGKATEVKRDWKSLSNTTFITSVENDQRN